VAANILFAVLIGSGGADASEVSPDTLPKDFLGLADRRGELFAQTAQLKSEIAELERKVSNTEPLRADFESNQKALEVLQKASPKNENERQKIEQRTYQLNKSQEGTKALLDKNESDKKTLAEKRQLLAEKQAQAAVVQDRIAKMLSPDQAFKLWASGIFSLLIGIVIAGFFLVSWKHEAVLEAIFSGQAGLQFLTLFSLVIAIILFGIMGILESKELSALLGGLSGYILGRGTATSKRMTKESGGEPMAKTSASVEAAESAS